ncbi:unnamed protein product [Acanthoscelides obtectus]|uniref:Uncharacterized protein n=1 Tax=Acanthoscelides obtectus TaxID=200917 RepID=A0A9P0NVS5_ACAOB|nr:unnamed protein product [Acanthoscelides obtectus]CAK1665611.1 hypothetical protein AOBTE_LOCUS24898 [Acanthoscelides obtectus]
MCLEIFCYHLGITLLHAVENILWVEEDNTDLTYMYISFRIVMYLQFFDLLSICCIARIMKRRYQFLNKRLIEVFKYVHNEDDILREIRELYSVHRKLYYLSEKFNDVYGWQIFFILISTVLSLLNSANFAFLTENNAEKAEFNLGPYVIYITAYPVFYACSTTALTLACEAAKKNAITTSTLLFRKLPWLPYIIGCCSTRKELMDIARSAKELIPTFSAGGFYQVNQHLLSSLFSTVTTYLIVIIQLSLST